MKTLLALSPLVVAAVAALLPTPPEPAPGWSALGSPAATPVVPLPVVSTEGALVTLGGGLSHGALLAGAPGELFLHLELQAADPPGLVRQRMNLALVIDRSGSMASEQKLEHAKSAADQLVARLGDDDRLAVVAYDSVVSTVVPSSLVPSSPGWERSAIHAAIGALAPGGSTNLHGGMVAGYEEVLEHYDPSAENRVLLVSDGLANAGISDPEAVRERAAGCRARGVRIATLGVGLSYDEVLMSGIAEEAGGRYHYIDDPEGLGAYLEQELEQAGRVVAKDVRVGLRLAEGVALAEVYGYGHVQAGDTVEIAMADLMAGEHRKVVLRLAVEPGAAVERPVASASLRCLDASASVRHQVALPELSVLGTTLASVVHERRDPRVLAQSEVVRNALVLDQAMRHQKAGEVDRARELLLERHAASHALNESEYHCDELTRVLTRMQTVAERLTQTRGDAAAARDLQLHSQLKALGYLR
jgi:Ca-activated chloride channel family protein